MVVPAQAGVILLMGGVQLGRHGCSRASGGDPKKDGHC